MKIQFLVSLLSALAFALSVSNVSVASGQEVESPRAPESVSVELIEDTTEVKTASDAGDQTSELEAAIERLRADLTYIASDELEGRDSGSEGIRKAANFIVKRYEELGLKTDAFGGSPFQEFQIPGNIDVGDADRNTLAISKGDEATTLKLGEQFTPLSLGSNGTFDGELIFAGYGITAEELGYDDYADVDVEGKVVIVLRREPQQENEDSVFNGTDNTQHALFTKKIANAKAHNVAAVLFVNDVATAESDAGDGLFPVTLAGSVPAAMQVPMLHCTRATLDPIVKEATGKSLAELEKDIDSDLKPRTQLLAGVKVAGETLVERSDIDVRNLIAVLEGSGDLADEYVIVGAHYDHVGMGGRGSLSRGTVAVHNGADDNGSGTVSILEIARRLSKMSQESRRTILFMSFTGEEKGLLGSRHYVDHPRWPLEDTVAMINLDMVGRLTGNTLELWGTGTGDTFDEMIKRLNEESKFNLDIKPQGTGPSDHASFNAVGIPVFHFFTKLHNQYHRPTDDVELVNFEGMERIVSMVTAVTKEIALAAEAPKYVGGRPTRRAIIGIILDQSSDKVVASEVRADGPAANAGMQAGDTIIKLGETELTDTQSLRTAMSELKPGDEVKVTVKRGDETVELDVKLGAG